MSPASRISDFFVAGGTLRHSAPSYIKRPADDELFNLTLAGEFCYVLTARQMGKSSLMIRTARRLRQEGTRTVIVDLTEIGTVEANEWYLGLLTELSRVLRLSIDPDTWWQERGSLGHVQRFTNFLRDVVLAEVEDQIVIFIDEIDLTLNLDFSDDFFAAIRAMYNARAKDTKFERLSFVLLGVAAPVDLIKDGTRTPFNIGQGIALNDFSQADAVVLQTGLEAVYPGQADTIFNRIYHWTSGHPYLTQKLCLAAVENEEEQWTDEQIDKLVEKLFLTEAARKETNLQYVRENLLASPHLYKLLKTYRQVLEGKTVYEDETSLVQNRLKLFGVVRADERKLKTRNLIYCQVFDREWVKVNMPMDWTRRLLIVVSFLLFISIGLIGSSIYYWQSQQTAHSDPTPIAVTTHINALGRLETAEFAMQTVVDLENAPSNIWEQTVGSDKLMLVAEGEVVAGFDLHKVHESDIVVRGTVISMTLPAPEILNIRIDNERTYVYGRQTGLLVYPDPSLESRARLLAEQTLVDWAIQRDIHKKAEEYGRIQFENLFRSLGFTSIIIEFKESEP